MLIQSFSTPDSDLKKNLLCLGKNDLEDSGLKDSSIPEIVSYFTKLPSSQVYYLNQEHGTMFHYVQKGMSSPLVGDALFTDEKDIALVVKTADCIPLFFWSESNDFVGIIHSGWRGTAAGISEKVIKHIHKEFGLLDLDFFMGPCIRQLNYEVGLDVASCFINNVPESFISLENEKYLFANDIALQSKLKGISEGYIIKDCNICNFKDQNYYSHRRKDTGRNLNIIWMNLAQ